MSILIKGMEMPARCENCFCYRHNAEHDYAYCNISSAFVLEHGNARPNNCPLVPVPPHGRLIDADAVMETIKAHDYPVRDFINSTDSGMFTIGIQQAVDEQPTIIPAEEGE